MKTVVIDVRSPAIPLRGSASRDRHGLQLHPARTIVGCVLAMVFVVGCSQDKPSTGGYPEYDVVTNDFEFADDVQSNAKPAAGYDNLEFVDSSGKRLKLADFRGKQNVVLVFMRGFSGAMCPYCQTQTSRLIANYPEFQKRGAEVLVVYPGQTKQLDEFLSASREKSNSKLDQVPFPILLDETLAAVDFFGIRDELAFPSTYILDKQGQVNFAYVGSGMADRPSIKAMLEQLDALR